MLGLVVGFDMNRDQCVPDFRLQGLLDAVADAVPLRDADSRTMGGVTSAPNWQRYQAGAQGN